VNDNLPYQITAVLFDLDNTLLDRDASFRAWAEAFVQAHFSTEQNKAEIVQRIIALDNLCLMLKESLFA
jgi:FMN phosphatase YigB (HAD superfamily)